MTISHFYDVARVQCNPSPKKLLYISSRMNLATIDCLHAVQFLCVAHKAHVAVKTNSSIQYGC